MWLYIKLRRAIFIVLCSDPTLHMYKSMVVYGMLRHHNKTIIKIMIVITRQCLGGFLLQQLLDHAVSCDYTCTCYLECMQ